MYICTFKYTPEDMDCRYCLKYEHRRCAEKNGCPYIAERIEAGAVCYGEAIRATFKNPSALLHWRLRHLVEHFSDSMWEDENHDKRFQRIRAEMGTRKKRDTPQFFAALYLLTANEDIYRRAYNALGIGGIEFDYVRITGISIPDYALVQAAKSIYRGTDHFTVSDLEDSEAVDTVAFRLVINALLIAQYGWEVMKIKGEREVII
ncbi:MAG: hypothetical protein GXZ14_00455 [Ruminococcaceae bacterium]|nr:hypothetical protein [Oscillospiraceae bacterium]